MKFNIEIDCTPEEVRRLMGLPDLGGVHDVYLGKIKDAMGKGVSPDMVETLVRNWSPMGDAGVDLVKSFLGGIATSKSKGPKT